MRIIVPNTVPFSALVRVKIHKSGMESNCPRVRSSEAKFGLVFSSYVCLATIAATEAIKSVRPSVC